MKSGNDQSWMLVLLGMLGVLGLRPSGDAPAPPRPKAAETVAESAEPERCSDASTLKEEIEHAYRRLETAEAWRTAPVQLIVTVPDPEHSRLAWYFDESVGAVNDALGVAGYSAAYRWLPWHPHGEQKPSEAYDVQSRANSSMLEVRPPCKPDPERVPGFILYRRSDAEPVIVWLVGESPIGGVHAEALSQAIGASQHVPGAEPGDQPLRVLGPFFSGSADALAAQLERQAGAVKPRVITGSATANSVRDALAKVASFESTVVDDDKLREFVLSKLTERSLKHALHIATLAEAGTPYGEHIAGEVTESKLKPCSPPPSDASACVTSYRFPLHVSQVQDQHDHDGKPAAEERLAALRTTLGLKLSTEAKEQYQTPTFSSWTPFATELSLRDMFTDIARSNFDYLEIVASDPADFIFLAQEAQKYASNVQIVTYGAADRIFSHPDLMRDLSGVLIGASYPLISEYQDWNSSNRSRRHFASELAEGVYNATLLLLRDALPGGSRLNRELLDWGTVSCPGRQLWLMMVANGRLWPLHEAAFRDDCSKVAVNPHYVRRSAYAEGMAWVSLLVMVVHLGLVMAGWDRAHRQAPVVSLFALPAPRLRRPWRQYLTAVLGSLALFAFIQLIPSHWTLARDPSQRVTVLNVGTLIVAWGLIAALCHCVMIDDYVRPPRRGRTWSSFTGDVVLLTILALCAGTLWFMHGLCSVRDDNERNLLLVRLNNPLGMCGLTALGWLATGFYAWGACGLMRIRALDQFPSHVRLPRGSTASELRALGRPLLRGWRERLKWPELALGGLFAIPACYFWNRMHPSLDVGAFDELFKLAYIALAASVVSSMLQVGALTLQLRAFLRVLAALPLVAAFDRIATKVTSTFGLQLAARVPTPSELKFSSYSLDVLEALSRADGDLTMTQTLRRHREAIAAGIESATRSREHARVAHKRFFDASRTLFEALLRLWERNARSPALSNVIHAPLKDLAPDGELSKVPTIVLLHSASSRERYLWERAAEDFVAMRTATFISHVTGQIRLFMNYALGAALLLACAVMSYPFQPERFLSVMTWSLVLIVVAASLATLVILERDEVLSRLGRTAPGRIDLNMRLFSQVFLYALLPLLLLVARAVPSLGDYLFRWFAPLSGLLQ